MIVHTRGEGVKKSKKIVHMIYGWPWNPNHFLWYLLWTFPKVNGTCPKSCRTLQYIPRKVSYKENYDNSYHVFFRYDFTSHIDVYEEYLIYDEIGMIGSVGQRQY